MIGRQELQMPSLLQTSPHQSPKKQTNRSSTTSKKSKKAAAQAAQQMQQQTNYYTNMPLVNCAGCDRPILDQYLYNVLDRPWHQSCIQCIDCKSSLNEKCFSRDGKLFCKEDFFRRFGPKCSGCSQGILPTDLVRRAKDRVFHLNCFTCYVCRKAITTGEQLYVVDENKFVCKQDYILNKATGKTTFIIELTSKFRLNKKVISSFQKYKITFN